MHAHGADEESRADADGHIAREIHVGHRVNHEWVGVFHQKGDGSRLEKRKVAPDDSAGNGAEKRKRLERLKVLPHSLLHRFTLDAACGNIVLDVGIAYRFFRDRFAEQVAQIKHVCAVLAHRFRKNVVVGLRERHMRHVIQQHLIEKIRHDLRDFNIRPVHQNGLQRSDFRILFYEPVHESTSC